MAHNRMSSIAFIARPCDQAIAWDHPTLRPAPLHIAYKADQDHPDFRSHDPGDGETEDGEDALSYPRRGRQPISRSRTAAMERLPALHHPAPRTLNAPPYLRSQQSV
ncbi:RNaseH domain-containing protein [Streptomyces sp. NPDC054765]